MKPLCLICTFIVLSELAAGSAVAQTRSVRDTATAYGARLNAKGQPANDNANRINSRVASRIDNRLALRIERYRPDSSSNPTAAYEAPQSDKSRPVLVIAPPPQDDSTDR